MQPQAHMAERAISEFPFSETQDMIAHVREQGKTSFIKLGERPNIISTDASNLLSTDESPYGAPVLLGFNNVPTQTPESFYVLDIRDVAASRSSDGGVTRYLKNGVTVKTSESATHLLINGNFDGSEEPVPGYAELSPGQEVEISRDNDDATTRNLMMGRFGIFPIANSGYSGKKHARVALSEDGKSISVTDLGSRLGTFVTTRKKAEVEAKPSRIRRISRIARRIGGEILEGGTQFDDNHGQEH